MRVVLVNLYELGRQPGSVALPTAWLRRAGHEVVALDLSLDRLNEGALAGAALVAVSVPMYTATRLALELVPRLRAAAPGAKICAYGLYAPANEPFLRGLGVDFVLGGECESALVALADGVAVGKASQPRPAIRREKLEALVPDRHGLPPLTRYAHLKVGSEQRTVGFVDSTRGCKHLCRHCPVVPVYQGKFYIVPVATVLEDVRAQVRDGARHISFGDPDFFNGPGHAERVVRALHAEFPDLTYDATIKIEHLVRESSRLALLRETGCLFITSAVESVDDRVLGLLAKGHTRADFEQAVRLVRDAGIGFAPTFVPFTPWTTPAGYLDLLESLVDLGLVESVPPVQLAIRLLIPEGSRLLELEELRERIGPFDPAFLGYPWRHPDPAVDALQQSVQAEAAVDRDRLATFARIWAAAHAAAGRGDRPLDYQAGPLPPHMSEPWYCCAEPVTTERSGL